MKYIKDLDDASETVQLAVTDERFGPFELFKLDGFYAMDIDCCGPITWDDLDEIKEGIAVAEERWRPREEAEEEVDDD